MSNRAYMNPIRILYDEMNMRCKTQIYSYDLFSHFTDYLQSFM